MSMIQVTVSEMPHRGRNRMGRRWNPVRGEITRKTEPVDVARAVRRVLIGRPLPAGQMALLKELYEAGDAGLTASELAARLDRSDVQLNRLLARLARRIRRTPGAVILQRPGITLLLDVSPDQGQWRYKLRRAGRKALAAHNPGWLGAQGESANDLA